MPEAIAPRKSPVQPRIGSFDVLKIVSAIAVVWIHCPETSALAETTVWCRFAVPLFTIISVFLICKRLQALTLVDGWAYTGRRAWAIYRLFLIWNLLYLAARGLKHAFSMPGQNIVFEWQGLLVAGFAHHLWFLPFLAVAQIGVGLVGAAVLKSGFPWRPFACLSLMGGGFLMASVGWPFAVDVPRHPITYFFTLAWRAFPAALLAIPLVWFEERILREDGRNWRVSLAFAGMGLACLAYSTLSGRPNLWHVMSAFFLAVAGLACPWRALPQRFANLGQLVLPVYVIHVLIIEAFQAFGHRLGFQVSPGFDLATLAVAILLSVGLAMVLGRARWLSWLLSTSVVSRKLVA